MQPMLLKNMFVYHFNLMTSATIYVPILVWGRKLYSLIYLCGHLFNKHFRYSGSSGGMETVDCLPPHFLPPTSYLKLLRLGFCHIIPKMGFQRSSMTSDQSSCSSSGSSVGLVLIEHLLPLGTLCLRIIIFLMASCP